VYANQLPAPTFYYMHECQDSLIQCSTSRAFCVDSNSLNLLLFGMNNITVQHTSAQFISTFGALILAGD